MGPDAVRQQILILLSEVLRKTRDAPPTHSTVTYVALPCASLRVLESARPGCGYPPSRWEGVMPAGQPGTGGEHWGVSSCHWLWEQGFSVILAGEAAGSFPCLEEDSPSCCRAHQLWSTSVQSMPLRRRWPGRAATRGVRQGDGRNDLSRCLFTRGARLVRPDCVPQGVKGSRTGSEASS